MRRKQEFNRAGGGCMSDFNRRRGFGNRSTYKSGIEEILYRRKIRYLVHFTRLENLCSILEHGILCRDELDRENREFYFNDLERYDRKTDCSCFSVEFPNCKMMNYYERRESDWAVLFFDAELLLETNNYYSYHNAATGSIRWELNRLSRPQNFEYMFEDSLDIEFSQDRPNAIIQRENQPYLKSYLPTSVQAEILIEGKISSRYIKRIIFKNEDSRRLFLSHNSYRLYIGKEIEVDKTLFGPRSHYMFEER